MMGHETNFVKQEQNALASVIKYPSIPDKNKVLERFYDLYLSSFIYNWKNSDRLAAKDDLKKYFVWSVKKNKVKKVFIGLYLVLKTVFFVYINKPSC